MISTALVHVRLLSWDWNGTCPDNIVYCPEGKRNKQDVSMPCFGGIIYQIGQLALLGLKEDVASITGTAITLQRLVNKEEL